VDANPQHFFAAQLKGEDPPVFATMRTLYELATAIAARHPWSVLADCDLLLVEDASSGEICYCSFMGELGEVFSMHAYLGSEGLRVFKQLQSGKAFTAGEFYAQTRCLFVEFVKLGELTPPDRALLKAMCHPLKRGMRAPIFRSMRPGYHPWYVTEPEGRVLAECARGAIAFWDFFVRNPEQNYWNSEDAYPLVVPHARQEKEPGYEFRRTRLSLPPPAVPEIPDLDAGRVSQVRSSGFASRGVWEVGEFYGAGMIGKRDERKACFRVAVAIDAQSGFAHPPAVVLPETSDGEALATAVFEAIEGAQALPVELHVRSAESKLMLEPLARALGFPIKVRKSLPAFDSAMSQLLKMMGDPGSCTTSESVTSG